MNIFKSERRGDIKRSDSSITALKKIMGRSKPAFLGSDMQDATEFFGLLLTEVKESLEKLGHIKDNLITSTFTYKMEESLKCSSTRCPDLSRRGKEDLSMWCDVDKLGKRDFW